MLCFPCHSDPSTYTPPRCPSDDERATARVLAMLQRAQEKEARMKQYDSVSLVCSSLSFHQDTGGIPVGPVTRTFQRSKRMREGGYPMSSLVDSICTREPAKRRLLQTVPHYFVPGCHLSSVLCRNQSRLLHHPLARVLR